MMRKLAVALACTVLFVLALGVSTNWVSLVKTHGNSMAPRIASGDLVVVVRAPSYAVGDVVAYSSADLGQAVLHRVVSVDDGRYTFRGDHNGFDDPEQPTSDQLIGEELLRIPQGGIWMDRLTHPAALALLAFGLLAGGGTALRTARRQRTRPMAQHTGSTRASGWAARMSPPARTAMAIAAVAGVTGLSLGALSWTQPATAAQSTDRQPAHTMTFSYSAEVPATPAYAGTTVTSPDVLFRTLVDVVQLRYSYDGAPGRVSVAAQLSTESGWKAEVPLQPAVSFDGSRYTGTVDLDLDALEARAQAAAKVIGIPASFVDVKVVPTVQSADGGSFRPTLAFALTPLQLRLAGDAASLQVTQEGSAAGEAGVASTVELVGLQVPVSGLRLASAALLLGSLVALGIILLVAGRGRTDEGAAIRRQYGSILLHVEPVTSPTARPVVDVVDFHALVKLAERYGLLIMHWTRSNLETFIVQDDGITYRYRVPTTRDAAGSLDPATATVSEHAMPTF